ncbi:uncharacterized protein LOC132016607 [Mustela nigripes]|uniref:uncharacterized protein LOC132016607 n=1 Tax=Mustela nigripes TaxID=77151 RepID=UPI002815535D|nr:uncharacterized protein LOC132016607 [Mustela nigripes]
MTSNWSISPATNILVPPPPRLVSENQARGPKPCPPGEPGARRSDPIVRSSDPRAGSTARAGSSNSALGSRLYVSAVLGSFFLPRQEMAPIFSSHGGLRPRRLWGSLIGVLFSLYFPGLRIALPAAALRPPSAGPGSRTPWARHSPLPAGRVTMAPSRPRPHPAALHFQLHLPGEVLRGTIEVRDVKSGSVETRIPRLVVLRKARCHVETLPRPGSEAPANSHVLCHPGS